MNRTLLLLVNDLLAGMPGAGLAGLRASAVGRALAARGHDLVYALPEELVADRKPPAGVARMTTFSPGSGAELEASTAAEAAIVIGWRCLATAGPFQIPVSLDLSDPAFGNASSNGHPGPRVDALAMLRALAAADHYTFSGLAWQRYYSPWLFLAGVGHPGEYPAIGWPFPGERKAPRRLNRGKPGVVICGSSDPNARKLIQMAIAAAPSRILAPRLTAERHSVLDPKGGAGVAAIEDSGRLLNSSSASPLVGIDLQVDAPDRPAQRSMAAWMVSLGVPLITVESSPLAELVERHHAGWIVPSDDPQEVRQLLETVLADKKGFGRAARGTLEAAALLGGSLGLEALDHFVRDPIPRFGEEDLMAAFSRTLRKARDEAGTMRGQVDRLRAEVAVLKREARSATETVRQEAERRREALLTLQAREEQLDDARERIGGLNRRLERLEEQLDVARAEKGVTAFERSQETQQLLAENLNLRNKISALQGALQERNLKLEQSEQCQGELEREKKHLEGEIAQLLPMQQEVRYLRSEKADLDRIRQSPVYPALEQIGGSPIMQTLANGNRYTRKALLTALYGANMAFSVYQKYWESMNFKIFPGT